MWILDSAYRDGGIDLWTKERNDGTAAKIHYDYDPPFHVHFHDPPAHHEMIAALEERYGAKEEVIRTLFGELTGYAVYAGRDIAEAIERQAQYDVDLFNVDVRRDQRFLAERGIVPCTGEHDDRFSPKITHNLSVMEVRIGGSPALTRSPGTIDVIDLRTHHARHLTGRTKDSLAELFGLVGSLDPDVILMPDADTWMPKIRMLAQQHGLMMNFSRNGKYRQMDSRSYWSYGRVEHKESALVPDGRIVIDTEQSFVYREGGLDGVLMAARLSGLPPNLASRFTPGTLVSSYETCEAVKRGIAVPFRKSDPEQARKLSALQAADRGGMMFQPAPGLYENVEEIDFTSMYPSIIVRANLSPESVGHTGCPGFLPSVLAPLLELRVTTKRLRKSDPGIAGIDAVLKWMLVTCFGYTGYKNAKFGRIEVHEGITARSRAILLKTKDIAEDMGFQVLHGIVDSLWVQGSPVRQLTERIEKETEMPLETEHFDWIVFLPLNDGFGAYTRYYGRQPCGSIKVRGIAARRHDTPEYVREMQRRMLDIMAQKKSVADLKTAERDIREILRDALDRLPAADPQEMAISRRISRLSYAHRCIEGAAVQSYREHGIGIAPGMKLRYVVIDARRYRVEPAWCATTFDVPFYRGLVEKAWGEIAYVFEQKTVGNRHSFF